jgi:hypothetical protein
LKIPNAKKKKKKRAGGVPQSIGLEFKPQYHKKRKKKRKKAPSYLLHMHDGNCFLKVRGHKKYFMKPERENLVSHHKP